MASGSIRSALLRQEVGQLRRRETRRVFDPTIYVGVLGGARESFVIRAGDLPTIDWALRTEVISSLLEDCVLATAGWLTRAGEPEVYDSDLAWLAAGTIAFDMHGRDLDTFHVITRYGWRDVRGGACKTWRRLRL